MEKSKKKKLGLSTTIFISLLLGALFGILLHGRFFFSFMYLIIYLCKYGLLHIYFILWDIIQCYFILLLRLFQL